MIESEWHGEVADELLDLDELLRKMSRAVDNAAKDPSLKLAESAKCKLILERAHLRHPETRSQTIGVLDDYQSYLEAPSVI